MIEVYQILNIYDKEVCPNLSLNNQSTRSHCFKLKKNRAQKDICQYYFTLRVTDIWNSLLVSVVTAETRPLKIIQIKHGVSWNLNLIIVLHCQDKVELETTK